jgi:hypothetical protein
MSRRLPVASSPGPLEDYAVRFDDLFRARAQREGFRRYFEGVAGTAGDAVALLASVLRSAPAEGAKSAP